MEYFISKKGFQELQQKRENLIKELEKCRWEMGESVKRDNDLRENPEFMSLRVEVMYTLPQKLQEIECVLNSCKIIEETGNFKKSNFDKVSLGSKVTLQDKDGNTLSYLILGYEETDIENHIISYLSSLAQNLIGKGIGNIVVINTTKGEIKTKITRIEKGI